MSISQILNYTGGTVVYPFTYYLKGVCRFNSQMSVSFQVYYQHSWNEALQIGGECPCMNHKETIPHLQLVLVYKHTADVY